MIFAGGDVFGKQARLVFAEFLPFLLVFPLVALQCGVNDLGGAEFSCVFFWSRFPLVLGSLIVSGGSGLTYTWAGRRGCLLITHFSRVSSMLAWNGLVGGGV